MNYLLSIDFCKMTVFHYLLPKLPLGKESNVAESDPVPTFLKRYNNEVGRRRTKPVDPSPRWIVRGGKFVK